MSSNTHDELTPSFEYRDPSREHHLEILMPTVDLDPAIPRNNLLPFTHLFIHIAEMYYENRSKNARVSSGVSSLIHFLNTKRNNSSEQIWKLSQSDIVARFNDDVKRRFVISILRDDLRQYLCE